MRRVIFVILSLFFSIFLLNFFGFKYFVKANLLIAKKNVEVEKKKEIKENFLGNNLDIRLYSGTLAKLEADGNIWVWGRNGLKRFSKDKDSVYRFLDGCQKELLYPKKENAGKIFEFSELVTWNVKEWQSSGVKVGDFIIVYSHKKIGFVGGSIDEVYTFNNWFFLSEKLYESCVR